MNRDLADVVKDFEMKFLGLPRWAQCGYQGPEDRGREEGGDRAEIELRWWGGGGVMQGAALGFGGSRGWRGKDTGPLLEPPEGYSPNNPT